QTMFTRSRKNGGFRETLVIYQGKQHFAEAVKKFLKFIKHIQNISPLPAPEWAFKPVWCSWYSHLYKFTQSDLEEQIPFLKKLGIGTVLVDASWFQSSCTGVGCINESGEYAMNKDMFPDFKGLAKKIHEAGLKLMLWCAPMQIGKRSRIRKRMEPYCVLKGQERTIVLCPFCKESKDHARKNVERMMRDYELDGIKLDFIDQGGAECNDPAHDHGDGNTGAAVIDFLKYIRDGILKVKPDAVIEYRIRYSTPSTLPLANCHRGNDSPFDSDYIRRENLFLRLFCEYPSAVWSDYAYWHRNEKPENVSLMLGSQIFSGGVPTLSVDLPKCSSTQLAIIKRWMKFYLEHSVSLAKAELIVNSADSIMSTASLLNQKDSIAYTMLSGQHIPAKIKIKYGIKEIWIFNASAEKSGEMEIMSGKRSIRVKISGRIPFLVKMK
ncbi:MAG TPA: alpha-galactosidase, partial [Victivallales bacterium]|nr:alpha-galactosidase [Victivallales bacterium]